MSKKNNLKKIIDLFKNDKFSEALILCDQSQDSHNKHIIKNLKGAIYFKQKEFDLAKKNFSKSIEINNELTPSTWKNKEF